MEWLDRCTTRVQGILLQWWMPVSHRWSFEHHKSRHCADPNEQCERRFSAARMLRAHNAKSHQHALYEWAQQSGAQKLPGHGSRWLRVPVNGKDGNFTSGYFPGCLRCYIAPMLGHKTTFKVKWRNHSTFGWNLPLVKSGSCRKNPLTRCVGHINEIARVLKRRRIYKYIGQHVYITTVDDELNVD